ncbi:MAG: PASTA domain-containing protein, partial [Acidobacteriaceae bacterium]|nr:PASTA domain-containing protein [Acidobacteriaceae bacterium]
EASRRASATGLRLRLENKYYSPDTPAGEVLAQFPTAGAVVRREWPIRVTESLGTQQVSIPGLIGQGERTASIRLRQLGLELGTVGHIPAQDAADPAGVVIAQSPLANATGVDSPRVSILVSDPTANDNDAAAYVMPSLTGLSLSAAYARAAAVGLHVASIEEVPVPKEAVISRVPIIRVHGPSPTVLSPETVVVAQTPLAGHRVAKGDDIHLTLAHGPA